GLMLSLQGELEQASGMVVLRSEVEAQRQVAGQWVLEVRDGEGGETEIGARVVVNAAGLFAGELAARTQGLAAQHRPVLRFCKGSYFSLSGRSPFSRLIYPMPQDGGLGVHLTLDLAGQARFGPDVQWLDGDADPARLDYRVDAGRAAAFAQAVRAYWPDLPQGALQPAYSGVRPKLGGPGEPASDFRIDGPARHGLPGLVNLFGIESPGLTSCLAIADEVLAVLGAG
ncbi:MAG: FAD-dependent oxidoreductase, partial [Paucibacter sp.]|nr:FAD-dependent oxidoreductase [Roseateles sp.]